MTPTNRISQTFSPGSSVDRCFADGRLDEKGSDTFRSMSSRAETASRRSPRGSGDANSWRRIFEANKDIVKNPDVIQPGWKLRIPE